MSRIASGLTRRDLLGRAAGSAAALAAAAWAPAVLLGADEPPKKKLKGNIKQSVSLWSARLGSLDKAGQVVSSLGMAGIDLVGPDAAETLKKYGLVCTMMNTAGHGIPTGFNRKENHDKCVDLVSKAIEKAAQRGWRNVICFSGNRGGLPDDEGAANCIVGLKRVAALAEEKKVYVCLELLNSKDHKDYMADSSDWGAKVCAGVGSPRIKLLFDIYHMAMMDEDVCAKIPQHKDYIGHYHTAGCPGRHELDKTDKQKLDYAAIMKVILDTKYDGYVAHEFTPTRDPAKSLAEAVEICDV